MSELKRIEPTEEMHAITIANEVTSEAGVTAEFITSQLNKMGALIFMQNKCDPQLVFDLWGTDGLRLAELLNILKTALSKYDPQRYVVNPAPKNFVPTETKILLTDKV